MVKKNLKNTKFKQDIYLTHLNFLFTKNVFNCIYNLNFSKTQACGACGDKLSANKLNLDFTTVELLTT